MRSLKYLSAALPLHFLAAHANKEADTTIIETITRTVTVCPIVDLFQCGEAAEPTRPWMDWIESSNKPMPTSATTTKTSTGSKTTTSGGYGSSGTTTGSGSKTSSVTASTSSGSHVSSTTTISSHYGGDGTTSRSGSSSTTTSVSGGPHSGSSTSTSTSGGSGSTTTSRGPSGVTTSSGLGSSSSTTSHSGVGTTTSGSGSTTTSESSVTTTSHSGDGTTTNSSGSSTTSDIESTTSTHSGEGSTTTGSSSATSTGSTTESGSTSTSTGSSSTSGTGSTSTSTGSSSTTGTGTTSTSTGSTTTTSSFSTTTGFNSTTSGTSSLTSSGTTSSSTTSTSGAACPTGSPGYHCPTTNSTCNAPGSRGSWCHSKSVDDDTHVFFETGQTKRFSLVLTKGVVDADGAGSREVFLINGKTPGEPIEANWGDWVEVLVQNQIPDNVTSIHWHGIRQVGTNDQDGVPGVTECGIAPGASRLYRWHATSYGTGWYHSHALAQYGGGLRGPLIIHGPTTSDYDVDQGPVMIDEKLDRPVFALAWNISRVQGQLPPASNVLFNGGNRNPADTTGIAQKWVVSSGKKYLFRIINSSAQSAYAVRFDGHKMKVVSADFVSITPYETEWLYISSGQRYNVIIEANQTPGAYYLRAITQTGCGARCVNDGRGNANAVIEYDTSLGAIPFAGGNLTSLNVQTDCKDEPHASLKPHVSKTGGTTGDFSAKVKLLPGGSAAFEQFGAPHGQAIRWYLGPPADAHSNTNTTRSSKAINVTFEQPTLKTFATVNNLDYTSPIFSSAAVLDGPANQWVYFVIQNNFQTAHPMHLHGHDFSVLGQGKGVFNVDNDVGKLTFNNPIRRDTANLFGMPVPNTAPPQYVSGWTVIGFETDNPGAWVMHCHILWHADGGMGLQYLERPGEVKAQEYYNADFQQQCANVEAYHAAGGKHKAPYEAGLKRHLAQHAHAHAPGHAHYARSPLY